MFIGDKRCNMREHRFPLSQPDKINEEYIKGTIAIGFENFIVNVFQLGKNGV